MKIKPLFILAVLALACTKEQICPVQFVVERDTVVLNDTVLVIIEPYDPGDTILLILEPERIVPGARIEFKAGPGISISRK